MGTIIGSGLFVVQFATPTESSTFLTAQRLINNIGQYCYVPFQVIIPKIASLYSKNKVSELLLIAEKARFIVMPLVLISCLSLYYFIYSINIYSSYEVRFVSFDLWALFIVFALLERSGATNIQLQSVNNDIRWHIANSIYGLLILVSMPFFYFQYGIYGIPCALIFGCISFYYPYSLFLRLKALGSFNPIREILIVLGPLFFLLILYFSLQNWTTLI